MKKRRALPLLFLLAVLMIIVWPTPVETQEPGLPEPEATKCFLDITTDDGLPPNGPVKPLMCADMPVAFFTLFAAKYDHTAITHRGLAPLTATKINANNQAVVANALTNIWGTASAITDGGAGGDITTFVDTNISRFGSTVLAYAQKSLNGGPCEEGFRQGYQNSLGVVAHETGHCIGLGHTNLDCTPNTATLMNCSGGPFAQDDRDGVCFLYPPCDGPPPSPSPSPSPSATGTQPPSPTTTSTPTATPTPNPFPSLPPLANGWNLVTAIGSGSPGSIPGVLLVYHWLGGQEWTRWVRNAPAYVNSIQQFVPGQVYWVRYSSNAP